MISNLERKREDLEKEMSEITNLISSGRSDSDLLNAHLNRLKGEYDKTISALDDKKQKLSKATRTLEELRELATESQEKAEEARQQTEEYKRVLHEYSADLIKQVHFRIAEVALTYSLRDLKSILPLSSLGDNGFLREMVIHGDSFLKCAVNLFIGYIDGATSIAQSCGGGGSTNDSPWGRDENEDDRQYALRCLIQASKMMRPSSGKSIKRK
jgi:hypothetical protein